MASWKIAFVNGGFIGKITQLNLLNGLYLPALSMELMTPEAMTSVRHQRDPTGLGS